MRRDEIARAVITELKNISAANGYYTEAGANVHEWLERPLGEEETPCIIVRDPESSSSADSYTSMHILTFVIDVIIADSKVTNTMSLREHISDVIKAFGVVCDEVIHEIGEYKGSEVIADFKGRTYASARLKFTVTYSTGKWEH